MVAFTPGTVVPSVKPEIVVDGALGAGAWVFRLVVVDNDSNESAPFDLTVTIAPRLRPPVPDNHPTTGGSGLPGPIPRIPLPNVVEHVLQPTPAPVPTPVDPRLVIRRPGGPT